MNSLSVDQTPDQPEHPESKVAQIIDATSDLLTETLPALEKNNHAYWRLILLALTGGFVAISLIAAVRMDPKTFQRLFQAETSQLCTALDSAWTCR